MTNRLNDSKQSKVLLNDKKKRKIDFDCQRSTTSYDSGAYLKPISNDITLEHIHGMLTIFFLSENIENLSCETYRVSVSSCAIQNDNRFFMQFTS